MRGIKFRAYIELENKMVDVSTIDFDDNTVGVIDINLMGHLYIKIWDFDQVEIMQYTGLKDKNNVLIYEGDIIRNTIGKLEKIVLNEGAFKTQSISHPNANLYLLESYFDYIEVIGNIYENPELLKRSEA